MGGPLGNFYALISNNQIQVGDIDKHVPSLMSNWHGRKYKFMKQMKEIFDKWKSCFTNICETYDTNRLVLTIIVPPKSLVFIKYIYMNI